MIPILTIALAGCTEESASPCAIGANPASIDDAFDTIGALPSPVTLECFLEALERPLAVELSMDVFSAQPAEGVESPRVFIHNDTLTLSVVPVGEARSLLEFGEQADDGLTVKAELEFPIELPLDPMAAFDRVLASDDANSTGCGVCHMGELHVGGGRFASVPLRPRPSMVVPLEALLEAHETCDPALDAERCAMFSALLDHGEVVHSPFPEHYLTLGSD